MISWRTGSGSSSPLGSEVIVTGMFKMDGMGPEGQVVPVACVGKGIR